MAGSLERHSGGRGGVGMGTEAEQMGGSGAADFALNAELF